MGPVAWNVSSRRPSTMGMGSFKRVVECIKSFLLPTSTERFKDTERCIIDAYRDDIRVMEKDRDTLKHLMLASRAKRMELLNELRQTLSSDFTDTRYGKEISMSTLQDDSMGVSSEERVIRISTFTSGVPPLNAHQEELTKTYLYHVETTRQLRKHLAEIHEDLENFKFTVKTQAIAELTNYRGVTDWAESMRKYTSRYATGLAALSIAGAGLVYSTIFGATRGDIGLMTFTFPLFTVGFLVPGLVHIGIGWGSSVPKHVTFASQRFWTIVVIIALSVASVMVFGAIVVVNMTIFFLDPDKIGIFSEAAGLVSLSFSVVIIIMAVMAMVIGLFSRRSRKLLLEYFEGITRKERDALNRYDHV